MSEAFSYMRGKKGTDRERVGLGRKGHPQGPSAPAARLGVISVCHYYFFFYGRAGFRLPWSEPAQTQFSAGVKCNPLVSLFIALT